MLAHGQKNPIYQDMTASPITPAFPQPDARPVPGEWAPHKVMWTAWPSAADLWQDNLRSAQAQVAAMIRALHEAGEKVRVLATGPEAVTARTVLNGLADVIESPFGDIWLRDTAPIFGKDVSGRSLAHCFDFNGWGGKYVLPHDTDVAGNVAALSGTLIRKYTMVMEGGSLDMDGEGTCLTTRQCLLNKNRNPSMTQGQIEAELQGLGIEKLIWLEEGLVEDHTDGHIDNIARFVAPGVVVCQSPSGKDDPNADILKKIADNLRDARDAKGRPLTVITVPSPGRVLDADGNIMAASHANFVIANNAVIVPVYNAMSSEVVPALQQVSNDYLGGRRVVGLPANAVLTGGGSFHCITQQEPR